MVLERGLRVASTLPMPTIMTEVARSRRNGARRWFDGQITLPLLTMINTGQEYAKRLTMTDVERKLAPFLAPMNSNGRLILARGGEFGYGKNRRRNVVGAALLQFAAVDTDVYHIDELYVAPGERHRPVISALLDGAVEVVQERGEDMHTIHLRSQPVIEEAEDLLVERGFIFGEGAEPVLQVQGSDRQWTLPTQRTPSE